MKRALGHSRRSCALAAAGTVASLAISSCAHEPATVAAPMAPAAPVQEPDEHIPPAHLDPETDPTTRLAHEKLRAAAALMGRLLLSLERQDPQLADALLAPRRPMRQIRTRPQRRGRALHPANSGKIASICATNAGRSCSAICHTMPRSTAS